MYTYLYVCMYICMYVWEMLTFWNNVQSHVNNKITSSAAFFYSIVNKLNIQLIKHEANRWQQKWPFKDNTSVKWVTTKWLIWLTPVTWTVNNPCFLIVALPPPQSLSQNSAMGHSANFCRQSAWALLTICTYVIPQPYQTSTENKATTWLDLLLVTFLLA